MTASVPLDVALEPPWAEGRSTSEVVPLASHEPELPATFTAFYEEHFDFVWRMLRGFGVYPSSVEDAAQDVFITAHRRLAEFRGDAQVRTWLCSIAYRTALNYRRSQRRKGGFQPLDPEHPSLGADPAREVETRRTWERVSRFLDELDDGKRCVFLLTLVEGMTAPEVAEALEIPMNTVYSRLHHARAAFRAFLEREVPGEVP